MTTEYRSNQGSTKISQVLDDLPVDDLETATESMWNEVHKHYQGASCNCPTIEALCKLYELGYRIVKE